MSCEHRFDLPVYETTAGVVAMCSGTDCNELAVLTKLGGDRPLTGTEKLEACAVMLEDVALAKAMTMIHGRERGLRRVRELRGWR